MIMGRLGMSIYYPVLPVLGTLGFYLVVTIQECVGYTKLLLLLLLPNHLLFSCTVDGSF